MSEQPNTAPAQEEALVGATASHRPTHLIWLLAVLSLLPGLIAATAREFWTGLPDPFRWTSYALSGLFMIVAVGLIVTRKE
jgi:hypothetical protein